MSHSCGRLSVNIRRGDFPDSDRLISARAYDPVVPWQKLGRRYRMFVPAQRRKVLIVVLDVPQLDEEVVRAGYYQMDMRRALARIFSKRTEVLSLGIVLAIGDALRVAFESALHLSGLPVPHLHRAVVARRHQNGVYGMEGNRVDGVSVPSEGVFRGTRRRKPIRVVSSAEAGWESGHVRVVVQRFLQPSLQVQYLRRRRSECVEGPSDERDAPSFASGSRSSTSLRGGHCSSARDLAGSPSTAECIGISPPVRNHIERTNFVSFLSCSNDLVKPALWR